MNENNSVFDDLMEALYEVEEYQKGNVKLKSHKVTIPDDEFNFYSVYAQLSEQNKQKTMRYVSELLRVANE
jgi:hypothetical protein